VRWLLDLQNSDGGIPTFCRGWGALPFDRSGPDLTAHALRAWRAWQSDLPPALAARTHRSIKRALRYLSRAQRADGAWPPLWFGNQFASEDLNLTYGTARVLQSLACLPAKVGAGAAVDQGIDWLVRAQNNDGGWGGAKGVDSTIEETALGVSSLADCCRTRRENQPDISTPISRGVAWLVDATDRGRVTEPSPIGFYFAKLWYFEKLYPLIFSVEALGRARLC
jgi:squalene-hopene/tetraprenyl-beta-curcumene cyclase